MASMARMMLIFTVQSTKVYSCLKFLMWKPISNHFRFYLKLLLAGRQWDQLSWFSNFAAKDESVFDIELGQCGWSISAGATDVSKFQPYFLLA